MPRLEDAPRVTIDEWEPTGDYMAESDPKARLTAAIVVNGTYLHLEAYAVARRYETNYTEDEQHLLDADADQALGLLVGDGGFPASTIEIDGREYCLLASPFGD